VSRPCHAHRDDLLESLCCNHSFNLFSFRVLRFSIAITSRISIATLIILTVHLTQATVVARTKNLFLDLHWPDPPASWPCSNRAHNNAFRPSQTNSPALNNTHIYTQPWKNRYRSSRHCPSKSFLVIDRKERPPRLHHNRPLTLHPCHLRTTQQPGLVALVHATTVGPRIRRAQ